MIASGGGILFGVSVATVILILEENNLYEQVQDTQLRGIAPEQYRTKDTSGGLD
jgi:hypothetical protein